MGRGVGVGQRVSIGAGIDEGGGRPGSALGQSGGRAEGQHCGRVVEGGGKTSSLGEVQHGTGGVGGRAGSWTVGAAVKVPVNTQRCPAASPAVCAAASPTLVPFHTQHPLPASPASIPCSAGATPHLQDSTLPSPPPPPPPPAAVPLAPPLQSLTSSECTLRANALDRCPPAANASATTVTPSACTSSLPSLALALEAGGGFAVGTLGGVACAGSEEPSVKLVVWKVWGAAADGADAGNDAERLLGGAQAASRSGLVWSTHTPERFGQEGQRDGGGGVRGEQGFPLECCCCCCCAATETQRPVQTGRLLEGSNSMFRRQPRKHLQKSTNSMQRALSRRLRPSTHLTVPASLHQHTFQKTLITPPTHTTRP